MPIDPTRLSAYAGGQKMQKHMTPLPHNEEDEEDDEEEFEDIDEDEEKEAVDAMGALERLGPFADDLRANAIEMELVVDELDVDDLEKDPSEKTVGLVKQSMARLPAGILDGLRTHCKGMSADGCADLAEALADEGKIEDPERFAVYLQIVCSLL